MIAQAVLHHHQTREWQDFWQRVVLGRLEADMREYSVRIFDSGYLVAEFTPENTPEFILETLEELKKEI